MRCSYCGSIYLVWDHVTGEITCGECGVVQERIYDMNTGRHTISDQYTVKSKHYRDIGSYIGNAYRLYRKLIAKRSRNLRKNVVIPDNIISKILNGDNSRGKRLFHHISDESVMKFIDKHPVIGKIIDLLDNYPRLTSRTLRAKAAIAFLAIKYAYDSPTSISMISKAFNLSKVQVRRLSRMIRHYPSLINKVKEIADYNDLYRVEKDLNILSYSSG